MIAEYINNTIERMIEKTKNGFLKWKLVDKIDNWESHKKQLDQSEDIKTKNYYIDYSKSYGFNKGQGYVLLLNIRYSRAEVFSPFLDRYILVIKISDEFLPQNLSDFDSQGYSELLNELVETIEYRREEEFRQPECLYDFLEQILKETNY